MKNWKTTIAAFAGAIWFAIQPIVEKGDFEIERDWKQLVTAAGLAVFGYLAKDAGVSGTEK
jgi:hypothetical protein